MTNKTLNLRNTCDEDYISLHINREEAFHLRRTHNIDTSKMTDISQFLAALKETEEVKAEIAKHEKRNQQYKKRQAEIMVKKAFMESEEGQTYKEKVSQARKILQDEYGYDDDVLNSMKGSAIIKLVSEFNLEKY